MRYDISEHLVGLCPKLMLHVAQDILTLVGTSEKAVRHCTQACCCHNESVVFEIFCRQLQPVCAAVVCNRVRGVRLLHTSNKTRHFALEHSCSICHYAD